jgi:pimeloyl-ACP methyl ester carboxylesterase
MYYEIHGSASGTPLVLLHGALSNIQTDFATLLPGFAKGRRVIAVEQQAHGRTGDLDRPLSYEQMADDTAELLRKLRIANADFFGYGMGGAVALEIATRHPALVRKIVFADGASDAPGGLGADLLAGAMPLTAAALARTPWREAHARLAPDSAHWTTLVEKVKDLDARWTGWRAEDLRAIDVPTLLLIGQADATRQEPAAQIFRLLGGGVPGDLFALPRLQVAAFPGTTRGSLADPTNWLVSMVGTFLDAPSGRPRHYAQY